MPLLRQCPGCSAMLSVGTRHDHRDRGRRATDTAAWKRRSRQDIAEHRTRFGDVCPGWRRPLHAVRSSELTDDHIDPLNGGGDPFGPTRVMCRSCNSARRDGAVD